MRDRCFYTLYVFSLVLNFSLTSIFDWHICICVLSTDDDECSLGTDNCRNLGPTWQCRNTLGSFRCERKHCEGKTVLLSNGECKPLECPTGYEASQQGQCIGKPINNLYLFWVIIWSGETDVWHIFFHRKSKDQIFLSILVSGARKSQCFFLYKLCLRTHLIVILAEIILSFYNYTATCSTGSLSYNLKAVSIGFTRLWLFYRIVFPISIAAVVLEQLIPILEHRTSGTFLPLSVLFSPNNLSMNPCLLSREECCSPTLS
jgi:hypothetical protein